ncbi:PadR family transcriptional regulator [Phenylobacterium sp.]|jgi:PadR family transcriptional regulator PadR|uniref:PadR family transcriptional regulator n=1 Tax=Phenylobacterium sp. TaxID=1871053 RepID=UPI002F4279D5
MGRDPHDPPQGPDDLAGWETQLRKGALSLAVLAILWRGRLYGLEILKRLDADAGLSISEGAIYPLLNRMKSEGLVAAEWVEADAGHPRKYYSLTEPGRRRARDMAAGWRAFASGVNRLLTPMDGDPS